MGECPGEDKTQTVLRARARQTASPRETGDALLRLNPKVSPGKGGIEVLDRKKRRRISDAGNIPGVMTPGSYNRRRTGIRFIEARFLRGGRLLNRPRDPYKAARGAQARGVAWAF